MDFFNYVAHAFATLALGAIMWLVVVIGGSSTNELTRNVASSPSPDQAATTTSVPVPPAKQATSSAAITEALSASASTTQKNTLPPPPHKKLSQATATATSTPPAIQSAPSSPTSTTITNETIAQINTQIRPSLVNILCTFRTANTASYISGSGLVIDPRGVVLTNAHVAQFFLLQNYPSTGGASCTVRIGNPAIAAYTATLLYLPPSWVATNASQILSNHAMGTGERDYAFLYVTGPAQFAPPLPSSFPALSLSIKAPKKNDPVLLAGYPAGALEVNEIQGSLYASSVVSTIEGLFTFESPTEVDVMTLGGTAISQGGSSGGAVVDLTTGKLVGLIVAETEGTTTASRDLRAITLVHIDKSLQADGEGGIASLLSGDLLKTDRDFNANIAPTLTKQLVAAIEKQP